MLTYLTIFLLQLLALTHLIMHNLIHRSSSPVCIYVAPAFKISFGFSCFLNPFYCEPYLEYKNNSIEHVPPFYNEVPYGFEPKITHVTSFRELTV